MPIQRRHLIAGLAAGPLLAHGTGLRAAAAPDAEAARRLHALFERYWGESAERWPEWATFRGDHRFGDRYGDHTPAGEAAGLAWVRSLRAEAAAIPADGLSPVDRTSRAMFLHLMDEDIAADAFEGWRTQALARHGGVQSWLAGLLMAMPADSPQRVGQVVARLERFGPQVLEPALARMARGIALGWVSATPLVERALRQLDAQLAAPLREGPFFEPLRRMRGMPEAEREAWRGRAEAAIRDRVMPAMQTLRRFIVERYAPAAPADGSLSRYPDGRAVYDMLVREHTTTAMGADEIHRLGLQQLARLKDEFAQVQRALGVPGSFDALVAHLNGPQYLLPSGEALLQAHREIAKRLDAEMPRLFAVLPRASYGIRPMPAHLGIGAADTYNGPPEDGSAPGWFNANVLAYARRPRWSLPTLVAHETVPGHHLQIARAVELGELPTFRRVQRFTAFTEGWGLYAEKLMDEHGFFATPEERFGHLQMQAFRAARLVVDTGLHALGWSRQRAIDFMLTETGQDREFVVSEVDRYLGNPGQALAYMVGQLRILALREQARQALGERFDLRRFHNAVLDQGSVPLSVLDDQVAAWIAAGGPGPLLR